VNYLGHVIEPGKLSVQATKVDIILKAKLPSTKTELCAYLGICNVYRRFVPTFATIAAPLTRHLRKDSPVLCAAKDENSVEFMRPLLNSWAECSVVISC
jgi:hypothetical protein